MPKPSMNTPALLLTVTRLSTSELPNSDENVSKLLAGRLVAGIVALVSRVRLKQMAGAAL